MEQATRLDRWSVLLLIVTSLYVAGALGITIARTQLIEQDAAYYCEVAERLVAGEGLTSQADRRGPAAQTSFPSPFAASTLWPALLAPLVTVTGEARYTGSVVSLLALIGALWLGTLAVRRATQCAPLLAAFCVIAALLHRQACSAAVLPLTDSASLCATAGVMLAIVARRPWTALLVAALAVAIRYQNACLILPLLTLIPNDATRKRAVIAGVCIATAAVFWRVGSQSVEGLAVLVDPTHRDSLIRALRFLSLPLLVGLFFVRRWPQTAPFWLLALGHVLVLLAFHDASDGRGWLFANRHGLPIHFSAAAVAAMALTRLRGWPMMVVFAAVCVGFVENVRRPAKALQKTESRERRPEMRLALDHLQRHPLPAGAIVLCHDCDVLAFELGIRGVHLRGHQPAPSPRFGALPDYLRLRGITHVLLTWSDSEHVEGRNRRMDEFWAALAPACDTVADLEGSDPRIRALLLAVRQ